MKPKKALAAYIFYSNEQVPIIKEKDGLSHKDAMKECGRVWSTLSDK